MSSTSSFNFSLNKRREKKVEESEQLNDENERLKKELEEHQQELYKIYTFMVMFKEEQKRHARLHAHFHHH